LDTKKEFVLMENSLDVIRLFAAMQVAITHYLNLSLLQYGVSGSADAVLLWFKRGLNLFPGVVILFAVSGFLMGASLDRPESRGLFLKKRFLRIYPALWMNVLLTAVTVWLVIKPDRMQIRELFIWCAVQGAGAAYTPEFLKEFGAGSINGALWTIMVEVQFYLLIWLFRSFLKKRTDRFWGVLAAVSAAANLLSWTVKEAELLPQSVLSLLDRTFIPYLMWFCLGILFYRYREKAVPVLTKNLFWLLPVYVIYKSCWLLLGWNVPGYYADIVTGLVLPCLVIGAAYRFGKHRIKNEISYGIFLYHWPLINLIFHYGLVEKINSILLFLLYAAVYLLLAAASRKFVEQPVMKKYL